MINISKQYFLYIFWFPFRMCFLIMLKTSVKSTKEWNTLSTVTAKPYEEFNCLEQLSADTAFPL